MTTWSCLIATCGDDDWSDLAWSRAFPSTSSQCFDEVIVEHHPEATLAEARNRILTAADCDWVVFLDADDELEDGYLAAMKATLERLSLGPLDPYPLLAPAVRYISKRGPSSARIPNRGRWPQLNECVIGTAVSRLLLLAVGGFDEWEAWEDWALWLKCVARGAQIVYTEDAIYRAHVSPKSRNDVVDGRWLHESIVESHRAWAEQEGVRSLL